MKIVTANQLSDGALVYLDDDAGWTTHQSKAAKFSDQDAKVVLCTVLTRTEVIADAYLVDIDDSGALSGRERLREAIRREGPTVRPDLARVGGW